MKRYFKKSQIVNESRPEEIREQSNACKAEPDKTIYITLKITGHFCNNKMENKNQKPKKSQNKCN